MATQRFITREGGENKSIKATTQSTGASNAGEIIAANSAGKLDESFLPAGVGPDLTIVDSTEALGAGSFVNLFASAGVLKARLADNASGRPANGYVREAVDADAQATIYPLDSTNAELTGLTPGAKYWLGTAGGVTAVALDASDDANANKIDQYLGIAKSATELVTTDDSYVIL
jgi:hypothetical protein